MGKRQAILAVGACTLLALLLRCISLNSALWIDEYTARELSLSPLYTLLTEYASTNQHPLFAILAHWTMGIFGETNWALRLPAVLFGVATVPVLYGFARRVTSRGEAVLACALLAVSYQHVWFSQNARGYTGMAFWATLASTLLLDILRSPRMNNAATARRTWVAYGVCMALGIYTHLAMAFVLIAHAFVVLAWKRRPHRRNEVFRARGLAFPGVALGLLLAVALHAPMVSGIYTNTVKTRVVNISKSIAGTAKPKTKGDLARTRQWQKPAWTIAEAVRGLGRGSNVPVVLALLVFLGLGTVSFCRGKNADKLFMALLLAPCFATAFSMTVIWHTMFPRFFFFAMAMGVVLLARGIAMTGRQLARLSPGGVGRGLSLVPAAAVLLVCLLSLRQNYAFPKQDIEGAMRYIEQHRRPGEQVITVWPLLLVYQTSLNQENWHAVENGEQMDKLQPQRNAMWTVYSLPASLRTYRPALWDIIERDFKVVKVLPGTLGDGDVYVCRSNGKNLSPLRIHS